MKRIAPIFCCLLLWLPAAAQDMQVYPLAPGTQPRAVAVGPGGAVWYAGAGAVGRLDPADRTLRRIALPSDAQPSAIAVAADGAPWVADAGRELILRIDPASAEIKAYALPKFHSHAELNTVAVAADGAVWFTGSSGIYGRVIPATGNTEWYDAPRGRGPVALAAARDGTIYFASTAASYVARIDPRGAGGWSLTFVGPPLPAGGVAALALGADGTVWIVQPDAGAISRFGGAWRSWKLPGPAQPTAIHAERGAVWLFDRAANAVVRFDVARETFTAYPLPPPAAAINHLLAHAGAIWAADSRNDRLIVVRMR
jgi:virginiamycin B lyase